MDTRFEHRIQWTEEDEQAFWEMWDLPPHDGGEHFWTGYDAKKVKPGQPPPPTIDDLTKYRERVKNVQSRMIPHEEPLAFPLLPYLRKLKQSLSAEVALLSREHSLYLLAYGVDLDPKGDEKFTSFELRLSYPIDQRFITYSMSPDTELEEAFRVNATVRQGIDAHLGFRVPDVQLASGVEIGGGVSSNVEAGLLLNWEYRLLKAKVIALGIRSKHATWKVSRSDGLVGGVTLRAVVLAPKRARKLAIAVDGSFGVHVPLFGLWHRERRVEIKLPEPVTARLMPT